MPTPGSWYTRTTASAEVWKPPAYGNGAHVLVSWAGKISRSTDDCVTFSEVTGPVSTDQWEYIVFDGVDHMILDDRGNFATSSDGGLTWSATTAIGGGVSEDWGGVLVVAGTVYCISNDYSATVKTSDHGATWTSGSIGTGGNWMGPAWDPVNNLWCVVDGASGSANVATSSDFSTWTTRANMPTGTGYWSSPVYAGGGRLICVNSGSKEGFVATTLYAYSTDGGVTWTSGTLPLSKQWLGPVSSDDYSTLLMIPYQDTTTLVSTDKGATWSSGAALPDIASLLDFGFSHGVFTATGRDGSYSTQDTFYCYYAASPDVTVAMTGSRATSAHGSVGVARTTGISGARSTSAHGSVGVARTTGISGARSTSAHGSVGVARTTGISGARSTSAHGSVGVARTTGISGARSTSAHGATAPALAVELAGSRATSAVGGMTAHGPSGVSLTGSRASVATGTIGKSMTVGVSGSRATAAAGTVHASPGVQMTGSRATAAPGSFGKSSGPQMPGLRLVSAAGYMSGPPGAGPRILGSRIAALGGRMAPSVSAPINGSAIRTTAGAPVPTVLSSAPSRLVVAVPVADVMVVATYPNTPATVGQPPASLPTTFVKTDLEVQDYSVNFSGYLAAINDSLKSGLMTAPPGIGVESVQTAGNVVTGVFSGGLAGNSYTIRAVIETAGGRAKEANFSISVLKG